MIFSQRYYKLSQWALVQIIFPQTLSSLLTLISSSRLTTFTSKIEIKSTKSLCNASKQGQTELDTEKNGNTCMLTLESWCIQEWEAVSSTQELSQIAK